MRHINSLATSIVHPEDLTPWRDEALLRIKQEHQDEIVKIIGQLDVYDDRAWCKAARQAKRKLELHLSWINVEIAQRRAVAGQARRLEHQQRHKEMMAVAAGHESNKIRTFKATALEVLGREMYQYLWELTNLRIADNLLAKEAATTTQEPTHG